VAIEDLFTSFISAKLYMELGEGSLVVKEDSIGYNAYFAVNKYVDVGF